MTADKTVRMGNTRLITNHLSGADTLNAGLDIHAADEPGPGGAHHVYTISWGEGDDDWALIKFQEGGVADVGEVNGISNEALLAIVEDRLACFQRGPFPCQENQEALDAVRVALHNLASRSRMRIARGVEGKQEA